MSSSGRVRRCELHRHLLQARFPCFSSAYAHRTHERLTRRGVRRKGLYPIKTFPQVLGMEASGTVVALPTDDAALQGDEEYKKRGLQIGSRVAVVRPSPARA